MTATQAQCTTNRPVICVAFELGWTKWMLGFRVGRSGNVRWKTIPARDLKAFERELVKAKAHFGLPADAAVHSCYEAGRDGFWLHRWLIAQGIDNRVVDSSSIEVSRRKRRAKSDRLDAASLSLLLIRHLEGEKDVWRVVNVPSVEDEDNRQLHRSLEELKARRTETSNRIKGLLAGVGMNVTVDGHFVELLSLLRLWDGSAVPAGLQQRLRSEFEVWQLTDRQIKDRENERRRTICTGTSPWVEKVRRLMCLGAVGFNSAWLFVLEVFGWRRIKNRRQLASLAGLCPTPYDSGDERREQGISKAGNRRMRKMLVEIAWGWLRWQSQSALSLWYAERFAKGTARTRKVGIVALARKLLIALWKYLETGEIPEGASIGDWRSKVGLSAEAAA
jgi:transposase